LVLANAETRPKTEPACQPVTVLYNTTIFSTPCWMPDMM
jgi:hypothetical protein